jgi:hypothetical protein
MGAPIAVGRPMTDAIYSRLAAVSINDAELSVRACNALQRSGRYKTLLDLDRAPDDDLFRVPHLGPKCIKEIRAAIRSVRAADITISESVLLWAREHETLILALMAGQAAIVPK